jgi:haloalkane dehalogenase
VMKALQKVIKGCPDPFEATEAGHFVQEWGDVIAKRALQAFGL